MLIMQNNCPGYFGNSPDSSPNNTILMVRTDATEGKCMVVGVQLRHETIVDIPSVVSMVYPHSGIRSTNQLLKSFFCDQSLVQIKTAHQMAIGVVSCMVHKEGNTPNSVSG